MTDWWESPFKYCKECGHLYFNKEELCQMCTRKKRKRRKMIQSGTGKGKKVSDLKEEVIDFLVKEIDNTEKFKRVVNDRIDCTINRLKEMRHYILYLRKEGDQR